MTGTDQSHCPSWIDDDDWTTQKTDWEFNHLLIQMDHRSLTVAEKEWIQSLLISKANEELK